MISNVYALLDDSNNPLYFYPQAASLKNWTAKNGVFTCPLDNKNINSYYEQKSLVGTDFLYYYVDELIGSLAEKKEALSLIIAQEKLINTLHSEEHFYPLKSYGPISPELKLLDKADKNIPPSFFHDKIGYEAIYELENLENYTKNYAQLVTILRKIESNWKKLDSFLLKYKVSDSTVIATQKNKNLSVSYKLSKVLFDNHALIHGDTHLKAILTYSHKVDSDGWIDSGDIITPNHDILVERNLKTLTNFHAPNLLGTWFMQVFINESDDEKEESPIDIYDLEILMMYPLLVSNKCMKIAITPNALDESAVMCKITDGYIKNISYCSDDEELKNYINNLNIRLEKILIEKSIGNIPATQLAQSNKSKFKSKI